MGIIVTIQKVPLINNLNCWIFLFFAFTSPWITDGSSLNILEHGSAPQHLSSFRFNDETMMAQESTNAHSIVSPDANADESLSSKSPAKRSPSYHLNLDLNDRSMPSMNAKPVLQFGNNGEEDNNDDDEEQNDAAETEDSSSEEETPQIVPIPQGKRHRRRLMVRISPKRSEALSSSEKSSTLRPPKDSFVIYALPEQSFWDKQKNKRKSKQENYDDEESSEEVQAQGQEVRIQGQREVITGTTEVEQPLSTTTEGGNFEVFTPFQNATTTTTEPSTTTTTTTTSAPPTTTITDEPALSSPTTVLIRKMSLPEKKFHLAQCMRYCMDAIL